MFLTPKQSLRVQRPNHYLALDLEKLDVWIEEFLDVTRHWRWPGGTAVVERRRRRWLLDGPMA